MARLMNDEDLSRQIIDGFLEDMPEQIKRLRTDIDDGDTGSAGNRAHTIKGAAANVGALAMSALALAMEKAGKNGYREELHNLLPELERQFNLTREHMRDGAL